MHPTENPTNVILVAILVAIIATAVIVRLQPHLMRQVADYLNARSDAEEWFTLRHCLYKKQRKEQEERE